MHLRTRFLLALLGAFAQCGSAIAADAPAAPLPAPLYVYLLTANPNADGSAICCGSAKSRPSGELEPHFFAPSKVAPHGLSGTVTGWIETRDGKHIGHLKGALHMTTGDFEGPMELDKRYQPPYLMGSNVFHFISFVLTRHADPAPLLKEPYFQRGDDAATQAPAATPPVPPPVPPVPAPAAPK